jgi:putative sigma-54 modulation protein
MEVIVSGRHLEIDSADRQYAEMKIQKLADEFGKLTSARVVFSEERGRVIAEAHINGKHMTLNATVRADAVRIAADGVFDKLERQLRRYLERIQTHRGPSLAEVEQRSEAEKDAGDDDVVEEELEQEFGV